MQIALTNTQMVGSDQQFYKSYINKKKSKKIMQIATIKEASFKLTKLNKGGKYVHICVHERLPPL